MKESASIHPGAPTNGACANVEFSPGWVQWLPDGQRLLYSGWDGVAAQMRRYYS